ncbi:CHAT domain-containing protein [Okeania sp. SIO2G5]|uniref:CHAT domain-containing protein n=1 Tax=Okeania sp. SIO2G5 TaxID=2607796 RepID=UPI00257B6357|nr:CHAT domain-containing protein [Okeania sp. SIO2G5]
MVHLATHGAFVSDSPDDSFLLFGDGEFATLRDMGNLNLDGVDLVVLSACQTGLGGIDLSSGIEVLGLGYQLQRAKAKAAIASLWRVSDGGTQTSMDAFYTALNNGYSKAEALQRAQQALITGNQNVLASAPDETDPTGSAIIDPRTAQLLSDSSDLSHPYYWAPFILIGNGL